jgi:hypothetical protein
VEIAVFADATARFKFELVNPLGFAGWLPPLRRMGVELRFARRYG